MPSSHRERGELLYEHGRYEQAIEEFQQALAHDPADAHAKYLLAHALYQLRRYTDALALADELLAHNPHDPYHFDLRAWCLLALRQPTAALAAVNEALALDPNDAALRYTHSNVLLQTGHTAEALAAAEAGLTVDPTDENCLRLRAQCILLLGRTEQLPETVTAALQAAPNDVQAHMLAGMAMLQLGNYKQAQAHFLDVLRLDPGLNLAELGLADAIKSKNVVYRWYLRYTFWLERQPPMLQRFFMFGGFYVFVLFVLIYKATNYPIWVGFAFGALATLPLSWLVDPAFTVLFACEPESRYLMPEHARRRYRAIPGLLLAGSVLIVFDVVTWPAFAGGWAGIGLMLFFLCWFVYDAANAETPGSIRFHDGVMLAFCVCIGATLLLQLATRLGLLGAILSIFLFAIYVALRTYWQVLHYFWQRWQAWRAAR